MKNYVESEVLNAINTFIKQEKPKTIWGEPLFGYADANDKLFEKLKEVANPKHLLPSDINDKAKTVIAYFLPFDKSIPISNYKGRYASREWVVAYIETNRLIAFINLWMIEKLEKKGFKTTRLDPSFNMDHERLVSVWSNRHVAYIAGLGKFGLNNMLITQKGCCGRLGNFITELELEPNKLAKEESCLYKHNKSCKLCVNKCVNQALFLERFDRYRCYELCKENARLNQDVGEAEVCGKCLVNIPCSFRNPILSKK